MCLQTNPFWDFLVVSPNWVPPGPWKLLILSGFGPRVQNPEYANGSKIGAQINPQFLPFLVSTVHFEGADQFDPYPQGLNLLCKLLLIMLADIMASDN
jgi:hypothetical protein